MMHDRFFLLFRNIIYYVSYNYSALQNTGSVKHLAGTLRTMIGELRDVEFAFDEFGTNSPILFYFFHRKGQRDEGVEKET